LNQAAEHLAGIVLCGGSSRRMKSPKLDLPFGDETMLQRTVRLVSEVCSPILIVAGPDQHLPEFPFLPSESLSIVRDEWPGEGPLSGLLTGFNALPGHIESAFVCGCDSPLLKPKLIQFLADQLGDHEAVIPADPEFEYLLTAVYRTTLKAKISVLQEQGIRQMRRLLQVIDARQVPLEMLALVDSQLESFRNVNTPEDYLTALKLAGFDSEG